MDYIKLSRFCFCLSIFTIFVVHFHPYFKKNKKICQICQFQPSGSEFLKKKKVTAYKSSFQATVDSDILSKLIVRTGAGYILREVHHLWRERERVLTSRNCIIKTTKMPEGGNIISINTKTADKTELG